MRKKISLILKICVILGAFVGIFFGFLSADADGYSHWSKRLLYFTAQSNVWIALTYAAIIWKDYLSKSKNAVWKDRLYVLKYIFTVSITLTGFIFCAVLAPGAEKGNYNAWTLTNVITHAVVPLVSVVDFFVDEYRVCVSKKHAICSVIPPFLYMIFAAVLGAFNVDFGRGEAFPYFFMNYHSPAGLFGTSEIMPYRIGSFYWIVFILLIILGLAFLYRRLNNLRKKSKKPSET